MRRLFLLVLLFAACPMMPTPVPDAAVEVPVVDAGFDAGEPEEVDAGRTRFDAGTADAGFSTTSIARWCHDRALAACLRQVRCLSLSEASVNDCMVRTVETCDQIALHAGVDAGRLGFDASAALSCLNGFSTGSCALDPSSCASVFSGLLGADAGCVTAQDCSSGTFCDTSRGTCPGRCTAFRRAGERCSFFERCDPALGCYQADAGLLETCQPLKAAGAACLDFDECGTDAFCFGSVCVRRTADAGAPCGITSGFPSCDVDHFCRQDPPAVAGDPPPPGICARRVGLGGTCSGSGVCQPSLRCSTNLTTGTCLARARRGELCGNPSDCEDGLFCSNASQRCEPFPGDGGDCGFSLGSNGRCRPGFFCNFNSTERFCERRRALGERCDYDGVCLSNECEYGPLPDGGFGSTCQVPCSLKADAGL